MNLLAILLLPALFFGLSTRVMAQDTLSIAPKYPTIVLGTDGATAVVDGLTLTRGVGATGTVTLTTSGTPAGLTKSLSQPGTGNSGSVTYTASTSATPGTYTAYIDATDGVAHTNTPITIIIAPYVLTVKNAADTTSGISGQMKQFMSTNAQPGPTGYYWNHSDPNYFSPTPLQTIDEISPHHVRVLPFDSIPASGNMPIQVSMPWNYNTGAASDWNFSVIDPALATLAQAGDQSPMFEIYHFPSFCATTNPQCFATYAGNMVNALNHGSFQYTAPANPNSTVTVTNPSPQRFPWWGVINEPNLIATTSPSTAMTPAQYETLYNLTATAMLQADPTIKIAAIALSDTGKYPYTYPSQATVFVKGMTLTPTPDAVTLHAYGTGTTTQTDFAIFNTLQVQFVPDIKLFETTFPNSAVWVTEFNADDAKDARNTNGFTTAFRPLGFAMFAKAGSQGFFPWSFEQSGYGDVDSSNTKSIGFQTDFVLENAFPGVPAGTSPDNFTYPTILQTVDSEPSNSQTKIFPTVNILATLNSDKSVTVMITNYAVANSSDVNQAGAARNVYLNVTALGTFSSGTEVDLNASTSTTTNATPSAISSTTLTSINNGTFQLNMAGYGTSVFNLKP